MSTSLSSRHKPLRLLALLFFALLTAASPAQAQWAEALPGTPDARLHKTVFDPAGNLTVAGEFKGTLTIGTTILTSRGHDDLFVARRSAAGVWEWAVSGGGSSADTLYNLMQLPTGEVCIAGKSRSNATFQDALGTTMLTGAQTFLAKLTPGGHWAGVNGLVLTRASINSAALEPTSGDVLVSGSYNSGATIGSLTVPGTIGGVFAGRLSTGGQWRWVEPVSCNNFTSGVGMVSSDGNGGLIMSGYLYETIIFGATTLHNPVGGVFIAHLTAGRTWEWAWLFRCSLSGIPTAIGITDQKADAAGNIYLAGYTTGGLRYGLGNGGTVLSTALAFRDMFVCKLNAQGQWQWGMGQWGDGAAFVMGTSVCVDSAGSVYVGGMYTDTTYTSPQLFPVGPRNGLVDGAVIRYDATGFPQAAASFGGTDSDWVSSMAINPANGHLVVGGIFDSPTLPLGSNTFTHTGGAGTNSSFVADFSSLLRPLGTYEEAAALARLTLSPNPAHGAVWLNLPAALHGPTATGTLLDGVGRVVRSFNLTGERTRLDIGGLAPGLYTVRVGALTRRVVVE